MIPAIPNTLTLQATKAGIRRGQCAEYCAGACLHVLLRDRHARRSVSSWLAVGRDAAAAKQDQAAGQALFLLRAVPHATVRGTDARGTIGPDLTHVRQPHSLALPRSRTMSRPSSAGSRRPAREAENLMPPYEIFTDDELRQLAA